jgi:transglutaminase-like putative cysteine protease
MQKILLFASFLLMGIFTQAQSEQIKQAWDLFEKDKLKESREAFEKLLNTPDEARAHLGISLVDAALGSNKTFYHYDQFYNSSNNASYYLDALWSFDNGQRTEAELEFLESVAEKYKGTLRAKALQHLGYHYRSSNKMKKAEDYFSQIGAIEKWNLVGDFQNISESGFDKDFGVLDHPEPNYEFVNKQGAKVKWFDINTARYDKWIDFEYHFYTANSIIYAQNFISSPSDQEVFFRIGTSGSLKFWLNDELLFQERDERNNGMDTYVFTGKLSEGNNRLLIQIGSSEIEQSNFLLRITDETGENIEGLSVNTTFSEYAKGNSSSEIIESPTVAYFQKEIEENPDHLENYLILAQHLLTNDKKYESKKVLLEAQKRFPDSSYLLFQMIQLYLRDQNRTALSKSLEELKLKFPERALSRNLLFDEALEIEDFETGIGILEKIESELGETADVISKKIEIAAGKNENEQIIKLAERGYAKYPDSYEFVLMKSAIENKVNGNNGRAIKVLEKYLKENYNENAANELLSLQFKAGAVQDGMRLLDEMIENNKVAVGFLNTKALVQYNLRNYNQAEKTAKQCIEITPYVGSYYVRLGEIYSDAGRKTDAIEAYEKAISYDPYDYETLSALRLVKGKEDIFKQFEKPDVYDIYEKSPSAEDFPEDNSMILLDEIQNVIYRNGANEFKRILVAKAFDTEGVSSWQNFTIPVYGNQDGRVEKAEVLKSNGQRLEAQQNGADIVFDNLEPGDAIHITYRLQNYYYGKLADQFWDRFYFSYWGPTQKAQYNLLIEGGKEFDYKTVNFQLEPTITEIEEDAKLYKWELTDIERVEYEPGMPSLVDVAKVLHISSIKDWDYIVDWYEDLSKTKAKINYEVEETVAELFEGKNLKTEKEKAQLIYNYIVEQIRYSSVSFIQSGLVPQKASDVISRKQGDCKDVSTLFVSMCEAVGIDAHLVLVNSKNNGFNEMMLPGIEFNHCIAKANLDGDDYYIELTDDNLPFGALYPSVNNAFVLDIYKNSDKPSEAKFLSDSNRMKNRVVRNATVSLEEDKMVVSRDNVKIGTAASGMRNSFENLGEEARIKEMREAVATDFAEIEFTNVEFIRGIDDLSDSVLYHYDFKIPSALTRISGMEIISVPLTDKIESLAFMSSDERYNDVEIWSAFTYEDYEETVRIKMPSGKTTQLPENLILDSDYLRYELSAKMDGKDIVVTRKFKVLQDTVPAEDFVALKEQCRKIIKADDLKLALN